MKRIIRIFFYCILVLLILVQFYPKPKKNIADHISSSDIRFVHHVPDDVLGVLKTSCYDCHSNHTVYPWYASVQPVSLWLDDHIQEGKKELNFSVFGEYSIRRKYKKLEEINEQVKEGEMPLSSYTLIHRDASLNNDQKLILANWVTALRDSFKANYPPDSLQRKKR